MYALVPQLLVDLLRFNRTTTLRELAEFVYTSYTTKLDNVLRNSSDYDNWVANLADLLPHTLLHKTLPLSDEKGNLIPFISRKERDRYSAEAKRTKEIFADIFSVLLTHHSYKAAEEFEARRKEIETICAYEGRVEALKVLIYYYRTKLHVPKYIYDEIKSTIS